MGAAKRKKLAADEAANSVRKGGRGESPEPLSGRGPISTSEGEMQQGRGPANDVRVLDPAAPNPITEQQAVARKASQIIHTLRGSKRQLLHGLWVAGTWKIRKRLWVIACMLNRHDMEIAPVWDLATGTVDPSKPSRYERCKRPQCRAIRGTLSLLYVQNPETGKGWAECDDFMVLAKTDCPKCFGRGYARKMILPGRARGKMPCFCIAVQPKYIERIPESELKHGSKGAVTQ